MRAAVERSPLVPDISQRRNAVKLLLAFYACNGSMSFPRGWIRAAMIEFTNAGLVPPTAVSLAWYRQRLADDPLYFEGIPGIDLPLLLQLSRR